MTRNEELEVIWTKALEGNPCECNTDDHWAQDITGPVRCDRCRKVVSEDLRPIIIRERNRVRNS